MSVIPELAQLLQARQFDSATAVVSTTLRAAAAESREKLTTAARDVVRWKGFFKNTAEAVASEPYFRGVYALLTELAGAESPEAMAAADNLGGLLGSIDKVDEAIDLREMVLAHVSSRLPADDPLVMIVRDGLSILYQRAGRDDKLKK